MHSIRSFIAIDLPPNLKALVGKVIGVLQKSPAGRKIRWSHPESLHLTLKFLGNIRQSQVLNLSLHMQKALRSIPPFKIEFDRIQLFPSTHQPRVISVGIVYSDTLESLYETIEKTCVEHGFEPEHRPSYPHLTIGRLPDQHLPHSMIQIFDVDISAYTPSVLVDHVTLFQSFLEKNGVRYEVLQRYKLGL